MMKDISNDFVDNFLKGQECPICGQADIVVHEVNMLENVYKCESTGTLLTLNFRTEYEFTPKESE